jgi:hypothetical protein
LQKNREMHILGIFNFIKMFCINHLRSGSVYQPVNTGGRKMQNFLRKTAPIPAFLPFFAPRGAPAHARHSGRDALSAHGPTGPPQIVARNDRWPPVHSPLCTGRETSGKSPGPSLPRRRNGSGLWPPLNNRQNSRHAEHHAQEARVFRSGMEYPEMTCAKTRSSKYGCRSKYIIRKRFILRRGNMVKIQRPHP